MPFLGKVGWQRAVRSPPSRSWLLSLAFAPVEQTSLRCRNHPARLPCQLFAQIKFIACPRELLGGLSTRWKLSVAPLYADTLPRSQQQGEKVLESYIPLLNVSAEKWQAHVHWPNNVTMPNCKWGKVMPSPLSAWKAERELEILASTTGTCVTQPPLKIDVFAEYRTLEMHFFLSMI